MSYLSKLEIILSILVMLAGIAAMVVNFIGLSAYLAS